MWAECGQGWLIRASSTITWDDGKFLPSLHPSLPPWAGLTIRQGHWRYRNGMSAEPVHPLRPDAEYQATASQDASNAALIERWRKLHANGEQIAQLADLAPEPLETEVNRFELALLEQSAGPSLHTLDAALRGLDDIETLLKMGLVALRSVEARGQDTGAPALALWREFYHARETILAILKPAAA